MRRVEAPVKVKVSERRILPTGPHDQTSLNDQTSLVKPPSLNLFAASERLNLLDATEKQV